MFSKKKNPVFAIVQFSHTGPEEKEKKNRIASSTYDHF